MSQLLSDANIKHFSVPSDLIRGRALASLSPEATKLYLAVVWRLHHYRSLRLVITNKSIALTVGLYAAEIRAAQVELDNAQLLSSKRQGLGKAAYSLNTH